MNSTTTMRVNRQDGVPLAAPASGLVDANRHGRNGRHIRILGIRGLPAKHGGFETFAERLAPYLVKAGWKVTVYCQQPGSGPTTEDSWQGVRRVNIHCGKDTALNSVIFDWRSNLHARKEKGICLTLGYNTGAFMALLKRKGISNLINMDGIEYDRAKWGPIAKIWFRFNEWAAVRLADHLIADHPEIEKHLRAKTQHKDIAVIAYGADKLAEPPVKAVEDLGLVPKRYLTVIARPEPENSLLEIVRAFSAQPRGVTLAVLGNYSSTVPYHRAVREAASDEVRFLGAIYDTQVVAALRYHSLAYVHGHRVGGSNPSLIEAMGAGNAVFAQDNKFNRWVVGKGACYFASEVQLAAMFSCYLGEPAKLKALSDAATVRHAEALTWPHILAQYEHLVGLYAPQTAHAHARAQHGRQTLGLKPEAVPSRF